MKSFKEFVTEEVKSRDFSEKEIVALVKILNAAAKKDGGMVDLYKNAKPSPSGKTNFVTLALWEKDEDSEPVGLIVTDGQTFQWRKTYGKEESGSAAQGVEDCKKLISKILKGIN